MATTIHVLLIAGAAWEPIGGLVDPFVIQNGNIYPEHVTQLCFTASDQVYPTIDSAHTLESREKESSWIGSQMWLRNLTTDVTVNVTV